LAPILAYVPSPYPIRHAPLTLALFFFNKPATTEIYTLSLHDALPIFRQSLEQRLGVGVAGVGEQREVVVGEGKAAPDDLDHHLRSEEHTSELQSLTNLVCRLLLEKKKEYYLNVILRRLLRPQTPISYS